MGKTSPAGGSRKKGSGKGKGKGEAVVEPARDKGKGKATPANQASEVDAAVTQQISALLMKKKPGISPVYILSLYS
jgi:hypothetical protein